MKAKRGNPRISTGIANLDAVLGGGVPRGSVTVLGGTPGSGKTILSQQIGFRNASREAPVVFFQTLSEPTAKTLSHASQFAFFDQAKVGKSIHFVDLGDIMRGKGTKQAITALKTHIRRLRPAFVVIDSFKSFDDLSGSREELRKFTYEVAVQLLAWECTSFLLGEFSPAELDNSPLSSVVDGIIFLAQRQACAELQRSLQVVKMRGTYHEREPHAMEISSDGIGLFAPRITLQRDPEMDLRTGKEARMRTGIGDLDRLIPDGIPRGAACLVSGASGAGKTIFALELLYRGASELGECGLIYSFGETKEKLLSVGQSFGWNLEEEIRKERLHVVGVPLPDIRVERHLQLFAETARRLRPKRIMIDSVSAYLDRIESAALAQERLYQLATVVQAVGAVGFFLHDAPEGGRSIGRPGVNEALLDGIIELRSRVHGSQRERELEIVKMRRAKHSVGSHKFQFGPGGISIESGRG